MSAQTTDPQPINVPPGGRYGRQGSFQGFTITLGSPAQDVSLWPCTAFSGIATTDWGNCTTLPSSCTSTTNPFEFSTSASKTWNELGAQNVPLPTDLVYTQTATYGSDNVGIAGWNFTMPSQLVGSWADDTYKAGFLGLANGTVALSGKNLNYPSLLQSLYNNKYVPSLSWGFTQGAAYLGSNGVNGSLVLGGYDTGYYNETSTVTMPLNNGNPYATLLDFSINKTPDHKTSRVNSNKYTVGFDTTTSFLFVTQDIIDEITDVFPVSKCKGDGTFYCWNFKNETWVDDVSKAAIFFTLSDGTDKARTITTMISPGGLQMTLQAGTAGNTTVQSFPIRLAKAAAGQPDINLGRAFFQEAYMSVDYERSTFNLSKAWAMDGMKSNIVAITTPTNSTGSSPSSSPASSSHSLSTMQIIPIVIVSLLVPIIALVCYRLWRINKRHDKWTMRTVIAELAGSKPNNPATEVPVTAPSPPPVEVYGASSAMEKSGWPDHSIYEPVEMSNVRSWNEMPSDWTPTELPAAEPAELPTHTSWNPLPRPPEPAAASSPGRLGEDLRRDSGGWQPRKSAGWGLLPN